VTDPEGQGNGGQNPGGHDETSSWPASNRGSSGGPGAGGQQRASGDIPPVDDPGAGPESDIDALFAAIVAGFSTPVPRSAGSWPASEDLADDEPRLPRPPASAPDEHGPSPEANASSTEANASSTEANASSTEANASSTEANASSTEDDGDGYVPPPPPPLPRGDLVSRSAWGAVVGGPLFLLLAALTWRTLPSWLLLVALLSFIGGFVTLVARMPPEPPDGPDDGAVV
jgi:hypothetical protein